MKLCFIWIQIYKIIIFHFARRLFAKHQTLSSWCSIFSSRSIDRAKFGLNRFYSFFYCCHSDIDFTKNCVLTNSSIRSQSLVKILWRSGKHKLLLSRFENIGMVSEKLYRNILRPSSRNGWPSFCLQAIWSQLKCQNNWKATLRQYSWKSSQANRRKKY